MRPQCLLLALCVFFAHGAIGQTTLSLDTAIRQALEKNLDLQRQAAELKKAQARLDESSRPPNPVANYSREDLVLNNAKVGEWIALGSLPLNFLWDRWSDVASKEKSLEAQRQLFDHARGEVVYLVKDAYLKAYHFTLLAAELDTAFRTLGEIATTARHRMQDGDISQYEMKRILVEVNRLRFAAQEAGLERISHLNQLRSLIGLDPSTSIQLAPPPAPSWTPHAGDSLLQTALKHRKDLKAVELLIESESSFLTHSRIKGFPTVNFSAGYKKQLDQFAGPVYQLNMEIPLFRRNQSEIANSEADMNVLERQRRALINQIGAEIEEASLRYRRYELLYGDQGDINLHTVFSTAVYSYERGELSLVEFIDGLNAYTDGMKLRNEIEIKYRQSLYQLSRVSGIAWNNESNLR